ncbi:MAG: hypothetical protein J7K71_04215, partial [Candidatus Omnitrophica bacterium]|nr:hypothetical protein [Candidatus Omnitrophota bacterium]
MGKEKIVVSYHSLLRKFNIFFIFSSLIPFLIIFYFYLQTFTMGKVIIDEHSLFFLLIGVG